MNSLHIVAINNSCILSALFVLDKNETPFGPAIKTKLEDKEVAKGEPFVIFRCGAVGL